MVEQTRIIFIHADGEQRTKAIGHAGQTLLDVAQAAAMPLEGTCEGQMACSTCHVIVAADDFAKLPRASEDEEDILDIAPCATRHSRLACQIQLGGKLDQLTVRIPSESRDMQGA